MAAAKLKMIRDLRFIPRSTTKARAVVSCNLGENPGLFIRKELKTSTVPIPRSTTKARKYYVGETWLANIIIASPFESWEMMLSWQFGRQISSHQPKH